ncbi:MAG TPA: MCP four helix bundle domain-containing protein, partial [Bacteroidota bacterium]|nr:MCP four helix bundle domain-containing protein [Bacteroidota bacterium]
MQWFYDLKTRTKIISSFLIVCAITAIVGFIGISNMGKINSTVETMYNDHLMGISENKDANINLIYYDRALRNYVLSRTQEDREKYIQSMAAYKDSMMAQLALVKASLVTENGREIYTKIQSSLNDYFVQADQTIKITNRNGLSKITPEVWDAVLAARKAVQVPDELMDQMSTAKEVLSQKAFEDSNKIYDDSRLFMILFILGGVGIGIAIGMVLTNFFTWWCRHWY